MKHGWLFSDPDPRDWNAKKLLETLHTDRTGGPLGSPSHVHVRAPRGFQLTAAACVGFALSRVIYMNLRLQGYPCPVPSARWIYDEARLQEHAGLAPEDVPDLIDIGCYPHLAFQGVRRKGFVAEKDFPFDAREIDKKPPPAVATKAYSQKGLKYYRIWDVGADRIEQAERVMVRGHTVMFGMRVDQDFLEHTGSEPVTQVDLDHAAGHGMAVLKVESDGCILVDNWWQYWGMSDGTGRISPEVWGHPLIVPDVFVVEAAPEFIQ